MVTSAYFLSSATTSGSARATRRKLMLDVRGAHASNSDVAVTIHNISATGLLIECGTPLSINDRIDIDLPHAGSVSATLVWASGRMFGCQFDTSISSATLSAAQLQSALDVEVPPARLSDDNLIPVEPLAIKLAENLKRLRMSKGLSQARVAELIGVSGASVSGWEKGRVRPKGDRLSELANLLGVPLSQLVAEPPQAGTMQELIDESRKQIARATGLTPDKIRIIVEF